MTAKLPPLLELDHVAIRGARGPLFRGLCWVWRHGEQWAILGPNGSGKSLLAQFLAGDVPADHGEIHLNFGAPAEPLAERAIAILSPHAHRELVMRETSFYQSRWHSGISEGRLTLVQFLSRMLVEDITPFEIGVPRRTSGAFAARRRRLIRWLGIGHLLRRKVAHLSNGEQRKALLAHTILRAPKLLILDDPFGGLDATTRERMKALIPRLMKSGMRVLLLTSRPDEIPPGTTHVLLARNHRAIALGPRSTILRHPLARQLATASPPRPSPPPRRAKDRPTPGRRETPIVELRHVTIVRGGRRILDDFSWTVRRGEHWALLGPNGSGKSTLLGLIQCDNPQAYSIDIRLFGARPHTTQALWAARRHIGWLSPELHMHHPTDWPCIDVVCSGFHSTLGLHHPITPRQRASARDWLRDFGLARRSDEPFGALPLGDQRLVLLARAVVKRPRLLILDEPCQGLDQSHRRTILEEVDRVLDTTDTTLIFVTHHANEKPGGIRRILRLRAKR